MKIPIKHQEEEKKNTNLNNIDTFYLFKKTSKVLDEGDNNSLKVGVVCLNKKNTYTYSQTPPFFPDQEDKPYESAAQDQAVTSSKEATVATC